MFSLVTVAWRTQSSSLLKGVSAGVLKIKVEHQSEEEEGGSADPLESSPLWNHLQGSLKMVPRRENILCGIKCLDGFRGQRPDWADWWETLSETLKQPGRTLMVDTDGVRGQFVLCVSVYFSLPSQTKPHQWSGRPQRAAPLSLHFSPSGCCKDHFMHLLTIQSPRS